MQEVMGSNPTVSRRAIVASNVPASVLRRSEIHSVSWPTGAGWQNAGGCSHFSTQDQKNGQIPPFIPPPIVLDSSQSYSLCTHIHNCPTYFQLNCWRVPLVVVFLAFWTGLAWSECWRCHDKCCRFLFRSDQYITWWVPIEETMASWSSWTVFSVVHMPLFHLCTWNLLLLSFECLNRRIKVTESKQQIISISFWTAKLEVWNCISCDRLYSFLTRA